MTASPGITAAVTVVFLALFVLYCLGFIFLAKNARTDGVGLSNKVAGATAVWLNRAIIGLYVFLIICSLIEAATSIWLLSQYDHLHFRAYPSLGARDGLRLSIFAAFWTLLTSTLFLVLITRPSVFLFPSRPNLDLQPVTSVGPQAIWALLTWCFFVACVAVLNSSLPFGDDINNPCWGALFCDALQVAFAFDVIEMVALTLGMLVFSWLLWRTMRGNV
ncbi:hypothetical protein K474DRAFT_1657130 [Panus rudis PR-1116 ss-1]|nr:hypothetical protein K474DRAFT_1657130 [Panus rudis PR-1116 ss-1]